MKYKVNQLVSVLFEDDTVLHTCITSIKCRKPNNLCYYVRDYQYPLNESEIFLGEIDETVTTKVKYIIPPGC